MTFLFDVRVHVVWLAVVASLLATVGLACAGVLYGALVGRPPRPRHAAAAAGAAGARTGAAGRLQGVAGRAERQHVRRAPSGSRSSCPFAVIYLVVGVVLYGPLQEAA